MTDNCFKNILCYFPSFSKVELCPPASALHRYWLSYDHLDHNFTLQWFRSLTGKTPAPQILLDCTGIKWWKCSQAAWQEAASSLPDHPAGLQHPLATATHSWKLFPAGVYWSSSCHHVRSCVSWSLSHCIFSLTHIPTWQLWYNKLWKNKHQALWSLLLANNGLYSNLTLGGFFLSTNTLWRCYSSLKPKTPFLQNFRSSKYLSVL